MGRDILLDPRTRQRGWTRDESPRCCSSMKPERATGQAHLGAGVPERARTVDRARTRERIERCA